MKAIAILAFTMCTLCLCGCTNKLLLTEVRSIKTQISKIDSLYSANQLKLFNYEKIRLDSAYNNISDDDLLRRIRNLTRPKN